MCVCVCVCVCDYMNILLLFLRPLGESSYVLQTGYDDRNTANSGQVGDPVIARSSTTLGIVPEIPVSRAPSADKQVRILNRRDTK